MEKLHVYGQNGLNVIFHFTEDILSLKMNVH